MLAAQGGHKEPAQPHPEDCDSKCVTATPHKPDFRLVLITEPENGLEGTLKIT